MQPQLFFVVLALGLVNALPRGSELSSPGDLQSRTPGNVLLAGNINFGGSTTVIHGRSGQCVNVPLVFNDNISSVGPDSGQDCFFFSDANCEGSTLGPIRSPGITDLTKTSPPFNDIISSFQCFFG
ncbi:hypothetical protein C8J56DRAFT_1092643 [Mycena floridula]|nr:hypothetical protein C8J56DRAFT_1092643 [Mycena floridula]